MKKRCRNFILKLLIVYIMTAVVLLCPTSPLLSSSGEDLYRVESSDTMKHSSVPDTNTTGAHSETGDHSVALLPTIDLVVALFFAVVFFAMFSRKWFMDLLGVCVASRSYYLFRHQLFIKPKLEKIFLRWLSRLGGTLASSL